jgi:orotate phosphoribosyltransferase
MKSQNRQVRQKYGEGSINDEYYQQLYELIKLNYFKRGNFTLSNGKQSDYYVDIKSAYTNQEFVTKANHLLHYELLDGFAHGQKKPFKSLGGLETGAIPMLATLSFRYTIPYFWVRKQKKDYGLVDMNLIGEPTPPVVIVEDVLNSGSGINKVANAVGVDNVMGVLCVVNRYEFGDRINLTDSKTFETSVIDVRALFKLEDFVTP